MPSQRSAVLQEGEIAALLPEGENVEGAGHRFNGKQTLA